MNVIEVGYSVTVEHSTLLPHLNGLSGEVIFTDFDVREWQSYYLVQFKAQKVWIAALELEHKI